jgi:stress response protein YsnF
VVARERVSLDKKTETEKRTVQDDVRRERVDIEGADTGVTGQRMNQPENRERRTP